MSTYSVKTDLVPKEGINNAVAMTIRDASLDEASYSILLQSTKSNVTIDQTSKFPLKIINLYKYNFKVIIIIYIPQNLGNVIILQI